VSTRHEVIGEEISQAMPVGGTRGRLRRIEKRASLELKAAIDAGIVSLRKADELIYQMPAKQHAYFTVRQARGLKRSRAVANNARRGCVRHIEEKFVEYFSLMWKLNILE
jgi:hypothetical protein